ncbi:MAG: hypothetical protein H6826_14440 [Planctomycetes bacterium]|nr:hypothetical protein [Planctomycetota bacterium]
MNSNNETNPPARLIDALLYLGKCLEDLNMAACDAESDPEGTREAVCAVSDARSTLESLGITEFEMINGCLADDSVFRATPPVAPPPGLRKAIDSFGQRLRERFDRMTQLAIRRPMGPWNTASTELSGVWEDFELLRTSVSSRETPEPGSVGYPGTEWESEVEGAVKEEMDDFLPSEADRCWYGEDQRLRFLYLLARAIDDHRLALAAAALVNTDEEVPAP